MKMHFYSCAWRLPYILAGLTILIAAAVFAHNNRVEPRSYEFRSAGHLIEVELTHENVLYVRLDGDDVGGRSEVCRAVP